MEKFSNGKDKKKKGLHYDCAAYLQFNVFLHFIFICIGMGDNEKRRKWRVSMMIINGYRGRSWTYVYVYLYI